MLKYYIHVHFLFSVKRLFLIINIYRILANNKDHNYWRREDEQKIFRYASFTPSAKRMVSDFCTDCHSDQLWFMCVAIIHCVPILLSILKGKRLGKKEHWFYFEIHRIRLAGPYHTSCLAHVVSLTSWKSTCSLWGEKFDFLQKIFQNSTSRTTPQLLRRLLLDFIFCLCRSHVKIDKLQNNPYLWINRVFLTFVWGLQHLDSNAAGNWVFS